MVMVLKQKKKEDDGDDADDDDDDGYDDYDDECTLAKVAAELLAPHHWLLRNHCNNSIMGVLMMVPASNDQRQRGVRTRGGPGSHGIFVGLS